MKKVYLLSLILMAASTAFAQGWQYVGTKDFNQSTGYESVNIPDMEINAAGEIFAGYNFGNGTTKNFHFAKYDGSTWTQLASPGDIDLVSHIDIEVKGSEYYMAYSRVRGSNSYVFVIKYNGSGWTQVGDSLILGNSGSGGNFEFLLDNNGVPTLLGVTDGTLLSDKHVYQYTTGSWHDIYTIPGTAGTVFGENSAAFDAQNKLYCVTQGYILSPFTYFTVVNKIDGNTRTTVGDTLHNGVTIWNKIKFDGAGVPYVCFNSVSFSRVLAFKLSGSSWGLMGDSTFNPGTMYSADVTHDGKVVFYTLASYPNLGHHIYFYDNNSISEMDSITCDGTLAGVSDVIVPNGGDDAYILINEITSTVSSELSVKKHNVVGRSVGVDNIAPVTTTMGVYPNPSQGGFTVQPGFNKGNATVKVYTVTGQVVYNRVVNVNGNVVINNLTTKGVYFVELTNDNGISQRCKLIID